MERLKDFKSEQPGYFPAYIKNSSLRLCPERQKRPGTSVQPAAFSLDVETAEGTNLEALPAEESETVKRRCAREKRRPPPGFLKPGGTAAKGTEGVH